MTRAAIVAAPRPKREHEREQSPVCLSCGSLEVAITYIEDFLEREPLCFGAPRAIAYALPDERVTITCIVQCLRCGIGRGVSGVRDERGFQIRSVQNREPT